MLCGGKGYEWFDQFRDWDRADCDAWIEVICECAKLDPNEYAKADADFEWCSWMGRERQDVDGFRRWIDCFGGEYWVVDYGQLNNAVQRVRQDKNLIALKGSNERI